MTDLETLIAAKSRSDERKYAAKHILIRQMMNARPDDFAIDSDDGRGIVGVTHRPTGFRFHMPKQKVKPGIEKVGSAATQAVKKVVGSLDLVGAGGRAARKTVDVLDKNPRLETAFRKVLSYNLVDPRNRGKNTTVGALAGALPGAVTGAAASDDSGQGGLKGAVAGALVGAAGGRYGPRGVQAGIGRVLTNVMDPHIYDGKMHAEVFKDLLKEHGASGVLKSIWKDKPLIEIEPARHALYRDFFGLKRFAGTEDVITDISRGADGGKRSILNQNSAAGRKELAAVDKARKETLYFDKHNPARHMEAGKPTLTNAGAMANFHVQPDGRWDDTWDFALNKGQKVDSVENLLRAMVTPFGTPTTLTGKTLSQGDVMRRANPAGRFDGIHESFTTPILNRGIRGSGANPGEFMRYVKGEINRGDGAAFMNAAADRVEGKPYNLLHSLAQAENVSPSELRTMLGGATKSTPTRGGPPKFPTGDLTRMFSRRIPESTPKAVQDALAALPPRDLKQLQDKLRAWSAAGHPEGGEIQALADTLGFAPEELSVLLQ